MILDTSGEPSIAANTTALTTITTASTEVASDGVPLFVIDAPLFQADPDVFDARPADLLEILEDACSAAKAAGYSDEEIARMWFPISTPTVAITTFHGKVAQSSASGASRPFTSRKWPYGK
jgi:hypothetical protein